MHGATHEEFVCEVVDELADTQISLKQRCYLKNASTSLSLSLFHCGYQHHVLEALLCLCLGVVARLPIRDNP